MSNAPLEREGFPFCSPSLASFGGSVFCIAYLPRTETKALVDLLEFTLLLASLAVRRWISA